MSDANSDSQISQLSVDVAYQSDIENFSSPKSEYIPSDPDTR